MPRRHLTHTLLALSLLVGLRSAGAAVLFELADDGSTFIYRARPGEAPSTVAESFGIPSERVPEFLAQNGITDPTRIPPGFVYRIPNPVAGRVQALTADVARLQHENAARTVQIADLERGAATARAEAATVEARDRRLARLEWWSPVLVTMLVLSVLGLAAALWVARLATSRFADVERRARAFAHELEERRTAALAEKQAAARHVLDLEERVRQLEGRPRIVARA